MGSYEYCFTRREFQPGRQNRARVPESLRDHGGCGMTQLRPMVAAKMSRRQCRVFRPYGPLIADMVEVVGLGR